MRVTLAIDPGKGALGWAFGHGQTLVACGLSRRPAKCTLSLGGVAALHAERIRCEIHKPGMARPTDVVVELMASYAFGEQKGDQNDLIELAVIGGEVAGRYPSAQHIYVKPYEWKGQTPKDISARRTEKELARRGCIEPLEQGLESLGRAQKLAHNVYDAVGIWLYATKGMNDVATP